MSRNVIDATRLLGSRAMEVGLTAEKIEVGLVLTGKDARRFLEHVEHPKHSRRAKELLRESYEMSRRWEMEEC